MENMENMTRRPPRPGRINPGPATPLIFLGWLIPLLLLVIAWTPAPPPRSPAPALLQKYSPPHPGTPRALSTGRPELARLPGGLDAPFKPPAPSPGVTVPARPPALRPPAAATPVKGTGRTYRESWPTPGTTAGDDWPEYVRESDLELD